MIGKHLGARTRISFGLTCLLLSVLSRAMMLGMVPNPRQATIEGRVHLAENIAVYSSD